MLRCSGCGELVSEWAARCPRCDRDTADAELLPEAVAVQPVDHDLGPVLAQAYRGTPQAGRPMVPFGGQAPRSSPTFARMVPLRRAELVTALDAWWGGGSEPCTIRLQRRLELGPPRGDSLLGWTFKGRVRRLTTLHWVPVVIELWPVYEDFVKMTMTPQVRVLASKRYFRLGHAVLDRLWTDMVETSSRVERAAA